MISSITDKPINSPRLGRKPIVNINQNGTLKVEFNQWNQDNDDGTLIYEDPKGRNQEGNINNYVVVIWKYENSESVYMQTIHFKESKQLYSLSGKNSAFLVVKILKEAFSKINLWPILRLRQFSNCKVNYEH